jgi:molybdopterin/thiamine biosynthesis adenylyltransferase/DNA-directed RNA polymerase subunit RPC12/RpoP
VGGSPAPAERYQRHGLIDWFPQQRVQGAQLALIGAGATGNEVLKNLVLLGAGRIDVFDFDRVEAHNLTRSIFLREEDIGASKAGAVAARAARVDPNLRVAAVEGDFWDTLSLSRLAGYDALVCCVDNFEARLRANRLCLIAGVDLINAAIDSRHALVEVFPLSQPGSACYECHLPDSAYTRVAQRYSCGGLRRLACEARRIPTTAITASIAGAYAAGAALRLGDEASAGAARRLFFDTLGGSGASAVLERRDGCPGCAGFAPRPLRVAARNLWTSELFPAAAEAAEEIAVRLSDPIVTAYRCARCGAADASVPLHRARDFDESILRCPACGVRSMQVEIRERFPLGELAALYGARPVPAKYALAQAGGVFVCIDLEASDEQ